MKGGAMIMDEGLVEVVYAIHDRTGNYWKYMAISIASMAIHTKRNIRINILVDQTISDYAKKKIHELCSRFDIRLRMINVTLPQMLRNNDVGIYSPASLYRLYIPTIFREIEQVIYMDVDTVFHGLDVGSLFDANRLKKPITGVLDSCIGKFEKHRDELRRFGLNENAYINSGVLIIRPHEIGDDLIGKFIEFCVKFREMSHPDQDFINYHFRENIEFLNIKYNYQMFDEEDAGHAKLSIYSGKILHYVGKNKPWNSKFKISYLPFWMYSGHISDMLIECNDILM